MPSPNVQREDHIRHLFDTLARYSAGFPRKQPRFPSRNQGPGDVILVTGTTGGLGCNILSQLCLDPRVKRIYALNRASIAEGLTERQSKALKKRGVLEDCLGDPKYQLVEACLSEPLLGINAQLYTEICNRITHIIHNAWPVNLWKPFDKFEDSLQGVRNLIDLALVRKYPAMSAPEESLSDSLGVGYAEANTGAEMSP
ncbi:hypothetical protein NLI96_g174 [Meripilus lineatus]|uniref:Thioester reductase (TE) domain-containing protein n=1 Tax=Meripilus lineatus TaxID=2056292 RepID=A0AAD5VE91_9APHY|nr:hypothetical protein NLI96_g174 [Physisporinus lineatus]